MADQKISELTALTGANLADVDAFAVVDTSAVQTKKITYAELKTALDTGTGFVRITGDTMSGALGITQTGSVNTVPLSVTSNLNSGQSILELRSTGSSSATIDLRADGTGDPRIFFDLNGATPFSIGVDNSDGDKFKISGSHQLGTNPRLTIDSSGNSTFGGTVTADGLTVDAANSTFNGAVGITSAAGAGISEGLLIDYSTNLARFLTYDSTTGSEIAMYTQPSGGSTAQRLRINSGGDISFYEDTGTTSKLQWSASNERLFLSGSDYQFGIGQGSNQPWYSRAVSDGSFSLHLNGTGDIITADSSGNLGIGTSLPSEKLHVEGSSPSIKIKANNEGGSAELKLQSDQGDDNQDLWSIKADPAHVLDGSMIASRSSVTISPNGAIISGP